MQFDKKDKFRCFRFVAYDEAIEKAKEELKNDMVPFCFIVHQPEKDEGKEHAHFMIDYKNTTTVNHKMSMFFPFILFWLMYYEAKWNHIIF